MIYGSSTLNNKKIINPIKQDEESLFIESLNILQENTRTINSLMKSIKSDIILSENSNETFLNEFSISNIISSIIKFFIEAIQDIFGKFKNLFLKFTMSDKSIEKYADKIKNIKGEFSLDFERYNYTCFDPYVPNIDLNTEFQDQYDELMGRFNSLKSVGSEAELLTRLQTLESDVQNSINTPYFDAVRSRCLAKNYAYISKDYFADELYKTFRDGGEVVNNKVDFVVATEALEQYQSHKKILKDVEKLKNDTIASAKKVEKEINNIKITDFNKHYVPYTEEVEIVFRRILSAKAGQVSEVCNIFVMAFSAKCDAIKESAKQNKKILYNTIRYINSGVDDM